MGCRDRTCFPGGERRGWQREARGLEGVRIRCSPHLALHSWEHRPQRKGPGVEPREHP